jgi:hypothetical protein
LPGTVPICCYFHSVIIPLLHLCPAVVYCHTPLSYIFLLFPRFSQSDHTIGNTSGLQLVVSYFGKSEIFVSGFLLSLACLLSGKLIQCNTKKFSVQNTQCLPLHCLADQSTPPQPTVRRQGSGETTRL